MIRPVVILCEEGDESMKETRARSLAKAASWQAIGLLAMILLGYFFTGSLSLGGKLAAASMALSLLTYLMHERVWARIGWGTDDPPVQHGRPR